MDALQQNMFSCCVVVRSASAPARDSQKVSMSAKGIPYNISHMLYTILRSLQEMLSFLTTDPVVQARNPLALEALGLQPSVHRVLCINNCQYDGPPFLI